MNAIAELPSESRSVIHIDPRTKIYLTITVTTIMAAGGTGGLMNYIRPTLAVFPIFMLLLSRRLKAATRFSLTYAILFIMELELRPLLTGIWNILLGAPIGIYTHILPGFVMAFYLIDTTTVSEFIVAMERTRIPQKIVIPISVVFRFFPTVSEECTAIQDAMKMRGITTLGNPIKMLEYRVVPLMVSIAKIGEELSAAALTRGLGSPEKRTNVCRIGFGPLDAVFMFFSVPCWIGFFLG